MKISILDAETLGDDLSYDKLQELGETAIFQNTSPNEVTANIGDSDVVILNKVKLNENNLKNCHNLKLICVAATGYDNIDITYCRSKGIAVCNVVGYSTNSVAQVTIAMALSLLTNLPSYTRFVNDGSYTKSGIANRLTPVYHEIAGKVWGVVGLGNIGKQVARVAKAMGCRVISFKRTPDRDFPCCNLSYMFKNADIISVHLPLSSDTNGIISKELIDSMKPDAVLINVARGAVCDENALTEAVLQNRIGGIGIDVYSKEPFTEEHPFYKLLDHPNVCLTPHMAWGAYEARCRCLDEIVENIKAFYNGASRNRLDERKDI